MEQRSALELETAVLGAIDIGTGKVGRQQIGGKLHSMKITLDAFAEYLDGTGFG